MIGAYQQEVRPMCGLIIGGGGLLFALGNLAILHKIGWSSDGPGALLFYVGAAAGMLVAWVALSPTPTSFDD
jgi:hypothetical protein